jgi:hypothetical protein
MDLSSLIIPAGVFIVVLGLGGLAYSLTQDRKLHSRVRNRLHVSFGEDAEEAGAPVEEDKRRREAEIADKAARRAADFYASADPDNVVRLRQTLMRAGYLDPDAVGKFFLVRFGAMGAGLILAAILLLAMHIAPLSQRGITILAGLSVGGYFMPAFMLKQKVNQRVTEYRNGFPGFHGPDDRLRGCRHEPRSIDRAGFEGNPRDLSAAQPEPRSGIARTAGRALDQRGAEGACRAARRRRGARFRDASAAIQGTGHQPFRRAEGLLRRNASQAHVGRRGKGACAAGENVDPGYRLHPAGGRDDRDHSDHREVQHLGFALSLA